MENNFEELNIGDSINSINSINDGLSINDDANRKHKKSVKFNISDNNLNEKLTENSNENKKSILSNSSIESNTSSIRRQTVAFTNKITLHFGSDKTSEQYILQNYTYGNNRISTTKYNFLTWFPKSLLMQFKRIANIYFLLISVLTTLSLSPKSPYSQIATFALVLLFTMIKEAVEDVKRYKMDNEINNKWTNVYDYVLKSFIKKNWFELRVGDLVQINKDEPFPADILLIKSKFSSGLCFVDTKDLDGETNLKEKLVNSDFNKLEDNEIMRIGGTIQCDQPNEYMDSWEGNVFVNIKNNSEENSEKYPDNIDKKFISNSNIKQLLLKGSILRNTEFIIGLVVYTGHNTKIMKNAKSPPIKMSNVMKIMNSLLLSVFLFQVCICLAFSLMNFVFRSNNNKYIEIYISINQEMNIASIVQKFFTFLVAYSHLIPISLYVAMEIVKLLQSWFVFYDDLMYDKTYEKPAIAKTSELIEELGQIQFIFSDKTGTLTQNIMEFKKCYVGSKIYGEVSENYKDNLEENNLNNFSVNGDTSAFNILSNGYKSNVNNLLPNEMIFNYEQKSLIDFFKVASICHSAIVEKDKNENLKYASSSPDEIALIQGAKNIGFIFTNRTTDTIEIMNSYSGNKETWEILTEIPFDSDRKRMTLIVKNREDKNNIVHVLCKGADNIMLEKMKLNEVENQNANDALYKFSCEGLRTLVLASRSIDYLTFQKWHDNYKSSMLINNPIEKEKLQSKLHDEIEKDFNLSGVSAIEDKLQEGVSETIELLIKSGIRIWVLTGDKKETASIIGRTCRLIEEIGRNNIDLTYNVLKENNNNSSYNTLYDRLNSKLDELIKTFHLNHIEDFNELMKIELDQNYYMITDGQVLIDVLKHPELSKKFFKVGVLCRSVICCRVSPKQKSQVVTMAKSFGKWITLAVGDGANDVPMIMEAHVGVGIQGKEGTQAVRSADYALCQFKFLQRLILIHGRNGYRRISTFICYYFYKNIILVFAEIYFVFFSGYSGQLFFPDILSILYNSLWTSWPCIFAWSIEKDIYDDKPQDINKLHYKNNLLGKNYQILPIFYQAGQKGVYFNLRVFWKWMTQSIIHGGICYVSVTFGLRYSSVFNNGKLIDHWWLTTVIFTMIVHVVTYKIFIELTYWNYLVIATSLGSLLFYYVCIFMIDWPVVSLIIQNELTMKVMSMFQTTAFWIYVICLPLICVMLDLFWKWFFKFSDPSPVDMLQLDLIHKHKEDVNIVRKLSTILDPNEVYLSRNLPNLPHKEKGKSFMLHEEKEKGKDFAEIELKKE